MSRRRKRVQIVARSKSSYPTKRRAIRSLEDAGYPAYRLGPSCHTGTYWRWEVRS